MNRVEKQQAIDAIAETLSSANVFYLADASELDAAKTSNLRRQCFSKNITMTVVKNKLLQKAMEQVEGRDYSEMYDVLAGPTAIMISEVGNAPAKLIKDFRKIPGVRSVKNFVSELAPEEAVIDITDRYLVTGFSREEGVSVSVVIDGKILSKGDVLDGMTVIELKPNAILLEKEGVRYRINYGY